MKTPVLIRIRSIVLFTAGIAGIAYETIFNQTDRPTLLILFAAMMGLPLFLKADEKTVRPKPADVVVVPKDE